MDVISEPDLKTWLQSQAKYTSGKIALRVALRTLPWLLTNSSGKDAQEKIAFNSLMCLLLAWVESQVPGTIIGEKAEVAVSRLKEICRLSKERSDVAVWTACNVAEVITCATRTLSSRSRQDSGQQALSAANRAADIAYQMVTGIPADSSDAIEYENGVVASDDMIDEVLTDVGRAGSNSGLHLWSTGAPPSWYPGMIGRGEYDILESGGAWVFWRRWYQGMLTGQPLNWELQRRVALIPDEDWGKGVAHIAAEIEKIEREWRAEQDAKWEPQARDLISRARVVSPQAKRLADLIEEALRSYTREVSNALPESIEPLAQMPDILRRISSVLDSGAADDAKVDDLTRLIPILIGTVQELNARLERAKGREPQVSRLSGIFQTGMSGWMVAAIVGTVSAIGGQQADETVLRLSELTENGLTICELGEDEDFKDPVLIKDAGPSDLAPVSVEDLPSSKS